MTDELRDQGSASEPDQDAEPAPPLNREQRRAQRFGRRARNVPQDNLQPLSINDPRSALSDQPTDPAFGRRRAVRHDAVAVSADEDPTDLTGPGTGGATETSGRVPHHEAMPSPQDQPNS